MATDNTSTVTFPLRISSGESIASPEALARCIATNEARAKGKGNQAAASRDLLQRIEAAKQANELTDFTHLKE